MCIADIAKATLVFFVKTVPAGGQLQVSPLTSAWTENATISTAPTAGLPLTTSASISKGNTYFAVDVTNLVLNWIDVPATNYGLALEPLVATTTSISIDSKEAIQASHPAYIEIALKGPAGAVGLTGASGSNGLPSTSGSNGSNGAPGVNGLNGAKGDTGAFPSGTAVGDMQYWNGTAWVMIPAPKPIIRSRTMAALQICNGVPGWYTDQNDLNRTCVYTPNTAPNNVTPYHVGDNGPAGGIIFYVTDATGLHGFEASPVDQHESPWGCDEINVGGTGALVGSGQANTAAINAQCGIGTAAQIAANYSLNGFTDWFLPSKDELYLLFQQRSFLGVAGLNYRNGAYWSSTENDSSTAWWRNFSADQTGYDFKYGAVGVRAIRSF